MLRKIILSIVVAFFIIPLLTPSTTLAEDFVAEQAVLKNTKSKIEDSDDKITTYANAGIATLTIFADPTSSTIGSSGLSYDMGTHAFITVKNISTSNITVGKLGSIAPGKTVSIGTWVTKLNIKVYGII
jgi:hypothetical protein